MYKNLIFVFALVFAISSCQKTHVELTPGTYSGTFTVTYSTGNQSAPVSLTLNTDGSYLCTSSANHIPSGGFGQYSINQGNLVFVDEGVYTADFDWNLILNGSYSYTFDGSNLVFSANKNEVGNYAYKLVKQ